eukprot:RCo007816
MSSADAVPIPPCSSCTEMVFAVPPAIPSSSLPPQTLSTGLARIQAAAAGLPRVMEGLLRSILNSRRAAVNPGELPSVLTLAALAVALQLEVEPEAECSPDALCFSAVQWDLLRTAVGLEKASDLFRPEVLYVVSRVKGGELDPGMLVPPSSEEAADDLGIVTCPEGAGRSPVLAAQFQSPSTFSGQSGKVPRFSLVEVATPPFGAVLDRNGRPFLATLSRNPSVCDGDGLERCVSSEEQPVQTPPAPPAAAGPSRFSLGLPPLDLGG